MLLMLPPSPAPPRQLHTAMLVPLSHSLPSSRQAPASKALAASSTTCICPAVGCVHGSGWRSLCGYCIRSRSWCLAGHLQAPSITSHSWVGVRRLQLPSSLERKKERKKEILCTGLSASAISRRPRWCSVCTTAASTGSACGIGFA
jgi:hypothetical protein